MNETISIIKSRRSGRRFKPVQIPDSMLREILECAICAPNARNQQKWHFTVVQNRDIIDKMESIMKENLQRSGIPEGYGHVCTIALGYKDEVLAKPRRRDVINYVR